MQKAQSAMEYLITYGWAIIIIGVTLAALYALGLFNPASFTSNQCVFESDFGCLSGFLYSNGTIIINLEQATQSAINVTAIGCNTGGLPTNMTPPQLPSNSPVYLPIGGNFTLTTQCRSNGTIFTSQPGTLYRGYLVVNYTSLQTGFQHVLVGKLIEKSS
jgi:hypothetical protein